MRIEMGKKRIPEELLNYYVFLPSVIVKNEYVYTKLISFLDIIL